MLMSNPRPGFLHMTSPGRAAGVMAVLIACGAAQAKVPAVLNHVPEAASAYIIVPDVGSLISDLSAFNQAMVGKLPPEAAQLGMGLFLAQSLATQPGFETNGSAAVLIDFGDAEMADLEQADPDITVLLPIEDLETFAKGPFLAGQGAQFIDGVLTATMPQGETFYLRDIGTHTVAGDSPEKVKAFQAGDALAAHQRSLRAAGERAVAGGDLTLVANLSRLGGVMETAMRQMEQQANFVAMMGGGDAVMQMFTVVKSAADALREDGSVGLVSMSVGADGVTLDMGAAFREGTPSAARFTAAGDTSPLMSALPRTDYLVAYAFDSSSESLRALAKSALSLMSMGGGEAGLGMGPLVDSSTGFSGVIGSSPAALGGAGLLAKQVTYARAEDPAKAIGAMRKAVTELNGQSAMGMTYTTEYTPGGAEVGGAKVDTYAVRGAVDPSAMGGGMMMDPAMIQSMMYGMSGGPSGFVAEVNGGFYLTSSKNTALLESAVAAGRGGQTLHADEKLAAVAARLHESRFAEGYLSADQMFNAFGPFAQMLGMIDAFEPIPAMSPIGLSASGDGEGMLWRVVVPADVLGFVAEFAQKMEADDAGAEDAPMEPEF